jgi:hypothetical protein
VLIFDVKRVLSQVEQDTFCQAAGLKYNTENKLLTEVWYSGKDEKGRYCTCSFRSLMLRPENIRKRAG